MDAAYKVGVSRVQHITNLEPQTLFFVFWPMKTRGNFAEPDGRKSLGRVYGTVYLRLVCCGLHLRCTARSRYHS